MTLRIYDPRVLAIDLRSHRSGFAIYEGPRKLLDYGSTVIPAERGEASTSRFGDLLKLSLPSVVVVKRERWDELIVDIQAQQALEVLIAECDARQIEVRLLEGQALKSTFDNLGCRTKTEISAVLCRLFPSLVWQLPPPRRMWDTEHPRQSVLDAIALGFAYWQHETRAIASVDGESDNCG